MDLPRPTASAALLTRLGVEHGLSDQACLQGTGLSAADLEDPAGEVVAEQELRIIENLLERLNDPPGLGLEAGVRYHLTTYGIWGFALISSPSMRSVIETGLRYLDLTFAHSRITAEECGTGLRILLDASDIAPKLRRFILEREAASIRTIQRELGFGAEGIREIAFAFAAPETLDCYVDVFGLVPTFDAPITSALVDAELLDLPLPQADTHATAMALAQCEDLLARRTARAGVAGQVRQLLLSRPADPPTAGEAAALLNQAERTLRHHLAEEGTSYRHLLDEVRAQLAEELLVTGGLPVAEVARRLGYVELSSFSQAFRRWHGTSPRAYRALSVPRRSPMPTGPR